MNFPAIFRMGAGMVALNSSTRLAGFADEKIFLGYDFMDRYEAPEIHRLNDLIK